MYRNVSTVARSFYRMTYSTPSLRLASLLGQRSKFLLEQIFESMGLPAKEFNVRLTNDLSLGTLVAAIATRSYLDMHRQDPSIAALRYEDLIDRPLETCRAVMEFCGLPSSLAELAVRGLEVDSQRRSPMSRDIIGRSRIKEPGMTTEITMSLNELLKRFGLPGIECDDILPGTLLHS